MWLGVHDGTGWWMIFAEIWMLLFWGPIIALAVWGIINVARGNNHQSEQRKGSPEITQSRYAQGEITKERFEEIKATRQGPAIRNQRERKRNRYGHASCFPRS
jgi:uncharacterized membrane protein